MKKIFLHVGHGKTGTSATQTALARLQSDLAAAGVCYPEHPSFAAARDGKISSGNIDGSRPDWFTAQVLPEIEKHPHFHTYVFSNENMFWQMDSFFGKVKALDQTLKFHVLLSVREPFEVLSSAYMQMVKRSGFTGTLSEYARIEGHINHAARLIDRMTEIDIPFKVVNYSVEKQKITKRIFEEIGIENLFDQQQENNLGTVNRSLSAAELQAVIFVNQIFGATMGANVSDALVNQFPKIDSDPVLLDASEADEFRNRIRDAAQTVNQHLCADEKLVLTIPTREKRRSTSSLSEAQSHVVRNALNQSLLVDEALLHKSREGFIS